MNAANRQAQGIGQGDVVRTPLLMEGAGLEVTVRTNAGLDPRRGGPEQQAPPPGTPPSETSGSGPSRAASAAANPEYVIDGSTVFSSMADSQTLQTPGYGLVTAVGPKSNFPSNEWRFANLDPALTPELLFRGTTTVPGGSFDANDFAAPGDIQLGDGVPTTILSNGSLGFAADQDLRVLGARIASAGGASPSGSEPGLDFEAGRNILVRASDLTRGNIGFSAPTVSIGGSTLRAGSGGSGSTVSAPVISVHSPGNSPARGSVTVMDSNLLLAMASLSAIYLKTDGSPISLVGSGLQADGITLDTSGLSADSLIEIRNSVLSGDVIRARAFNSGDRDAIVISGSTFNANQLISFYAEGASKLRFQGENRLVLGTSGISNFAGRTVQVDKGGNVNVTGSANIFRDIDNYNKPDYGNINVSGRQSHQPFAARP